MNTPALTDPSVLVTAIAAALKPYCVDGYHEEIARNSVQALIAGEDATAQVVIADAMMRRARYVRHVYHASELAARAYLVAERPASQRARFLLAIGVENPTAYLREHGLMAPAAEVAA